MLQTQISLYGNSSLRQHTKSGIACVFSFCWLWADSGAGEATKTLGRANPACSRPHTRAHLLIRFNLMIAKHKKKLPTASGRLGVGVELPLQVDPLVVNPLDATHKNTHTHWGRTDTHQCESLSQCVCGLHSLGLASRYYMLAARTYT